MGLLQRLFGKKDQPPPHQPKPPEPPQKAPEQPPEAKQEERPSELPPQPPEKIFDWYEAMIQAGQFVEEQGRERFYEHAKLHLSIVAGSLLIASYIIANNLPPLLLVSVTGICVFGVINTIIWARQIARTAYYEGVWYGFAADVEDTPEFQAATGNLMVTDPQYDGPRRVQTFSRPYIRERLNPLKKYLGITPLMYLTFALSLALIVYPLLAAGSFYFYLEKKASSETRRSDFII